MDVIGPHVQQGHYDLIGPSGEIILPQMWDKVVEPDWSVTMHMWPMDRKPQRANFPAPPPLPPPMSGQNLPPRPQPLPAPRPPMPRQPMPGPGMHPPGPRIVPIHKRFDSDSESESDDEKMFSLRSYLGNKMKRLRKRVTHKSDSDSIHSSTSSAISL